MERNSVAADVRRLKLLSSDLTRISNPRSMEIRDLGCYDASGRGDNGIRISRGLSNARS